MTSALKKWGLVLLTPIFLGISSGGVVELEGYFNARYSANFLKSTRNVRFVMPPGTQGKIEEIKKFHSGNYGLKMEILAGKNKGEKVWVYYNPKDPGMKLYENDVQTAAPTETKEVEKAKQVKTTREQTALRVPASADRQEKVAEAAQISKQIKDVNETLRGQGRTGGPCADCEVSKVYARESAPIEKSSARVVSSDRPVLRPPSRTVNPYGIRPVRCRSAGGGTYDSCTFEGDSEPGKFHLTNRGPNAIVSAGNSRSRQWSFEFEGNARQDLSLAISDAPNATISQTQESYIMLFPRKTLPHIRVEGNRQIVTLPTGETVVFNAQTREVIGGVLTENGPMTSGGKQLSPAKVSYQGQGVMVRVDSRGNDPRHQPRGTATISKQGRTCKVPVKDLWPNQAQNSAFHFKYFSDSDFDTYLKQKCGFGL